MKAIALIVDGVVSEVQNLVDEVDHTRLYGPDINWVDVSSMQDKPARGYLYDPQGGFYAPIVVEPQPLPEPEHAPTVAELMTLLVAKGMLSDGEAEAVAKGAVS